MKRMREIGPRHYPTVKAIDRIAFKLVRRERELNQVQLAEKAGVYAGAVQRIEQGKNISVPLAESIAGALGRPVEDLFVSPIGTAVPLRRSGNAVLPAPATNRSDPHVGSVSHDEDGWAAERTYFRYRDESCPLIESRELVRLLEERYRCTALSFGRTLVPVTVLWKNARRLIHPDTILGDFDFTQPAPFTRSPLFTAPEYARARAFIERQYGSGRIRYDGCDYRMTRIESSSRPPRIHGAFGFYYDTILTQYAIEWELKKALLGTGRSGIPEQLPHGTLPLREAVEAEGNPLLSGHGRCAALSISTLLVFARRIGSFSCLIRRRSMEVGVSPGVLHVVPAAMFEASNTIDPWSIELNVWRELLEELYDDEDLQGSQFAEIRHAAPLSEVQNRRRKAAYYWTVTIVLALAGFVFSLLSFDPYRLGWKSYLYCLGIAIVTPFLIEEVIERWNLEKLVRTLATVAGIAALVSLVLLAVIRGDLLAHETQGADPVVVSDDAEAGTTATPQPQQDDFYGETLILLRLAMALLAVAMELGAGLALHRAWRTTEVTVDDWNELRGELRKLRGQMVALATEMTALQNEPAIFVARFWRNFYYAMLTHTARNAIAKLLVGALLVMIPAFHMKAAAEEQVTIVAAIDLTQSVGTAGADQKTDFQKNLTGVTNLLGQAPVSSRVIVLGITDKSFAQPYILLSARVGDDPGYFGERLAAARRQLVATWKHRSAMLQPEFKYTDIVGVLLIAGQLFDASPKASRKILVIFSDMRHYTRELDVESPGVVPPLAVLERKSGTIPTAHLQNVEVHVVGVDGAGKSLAYWQGLQRFWTEYFDRSRAILRTYSVLRDLPPVAQ